MFKYRSDVDGLRAVAVIIVVLYHAGVGFNGGYVGVDVFFVISGFLITGLILKRLETDTFTLRDFWSRRIRRIVPAAAVMTATTLFAGYLLLLPNDFKELGESAIAQQLFLSNFYFWRTGGYFATAAEFKPLLHTWSLAVEEQFYIFYPVAIIALQKMNRKSIPWALLFVTLLSFGLSVWGVANKPSAAFFLLPTRIWELTIGGLIWYFPKQLSQKRLLELASLVGIGLIFYSSIFFHEDTPFPGLNALFPCVGATLIILSNGSYLTFVGKLLSTRLFVFIGLISYSLYLWHWPILVCLSNCPIENHILGTSIALILSFVMAVLSWRFIESPARKKIDPKSQKRLVSFLLATAPALILLAGIIVVEKGFPGRVPELTNKYMSVATDKQFIFEGTIDDAKEGRFPKFGSKNAKSKCLVWGDSHAMHLMPGITASALKNEVEIIQATHSSTCPLLGLVHEGPSFSNKAEEFSRLVVKYCESNGVDKVILSGVWSVYSSYPKFKNEFIETIQQLRSMKIKVAVVLDVAVQTQDPPRYFAVREWWWGEIDPDQQQLLGQSHEDYLLRNQCNRFIIDEADEKFTLIDPKSIFVNEKGIWPMAIDGLLLYRDAGHLSTEGGAMTEPLFDIFFEQ